jgi:hypothetical protein
MSNVALSSYVRGTLFSNQISRDPDRLAAMAYGDEPYDRSWFASAFFQAGNLIVQQCIKDPGLNDVLVFPALYCYRHGFELAIKKLLECLDTSPPNLNKGHQLLHQDRWKRLRPLLQGVYSTRKWTRLDKPTLDGVENLLTDIETIDDSGASFRYPTDPTGQPVFSNGEIYDLHDIAIWLKELAKWFDDVILCVQDGL